MALLLMAVSYFTGYGANYIRTISLDGIKYALYDDMTAVVTGYDEDSILKDIVIPDKVDESYDVVAVGSDAFRECTSLESIDMNSITSIGRSAFSNCESLKSVAMNNVTSLEEVAFCGCESLESIELPNVTSIGSSAFLVCKSLKSAAINNVHNIGEFAFYYCKSLESIEINNVSTIARCLFYECTSLKIVEMRNASTIEEDAFAGCNSLKTIEMNNVTSIEMSAFCNCRSLESIEMKNATSIGPLAFYNCSSLESIELEHANYVYEEAFELCSSLKTVKLNNVTAIGYLAFADCVSLESIELNNNAAIPTGLFYGCTSLKTVEMKNATSIDNYAFAGCSSLSTIVLERPTPPSFNGEDVFLNVEDCVVEIPYGSKVNYKEAWGTNPVGGTNFSYKYPRGASLNVSNAAGELINNVDESQISNITKLTVSGEINGTDLNVINRMANLECLDLSDCRVVAGGEAYYDTNYYTKADFLSSYSIRLNSLDSIAYPQVWKIEANAVSQTPYLLHAIVPSTVSYFYDYTPGEDYRFECDDRSLDLKTISAKRVWLGRNLPATTQYFKQRFNTSKLEEVTIAYPYTKFGDGFFSDCSKIVSFKIPASVQKIGSQTFARCTALKEVICGAQTPPSAVADSFDESTYKDATLYVPVGTRNAYFFDPVWGMFANIVESEELTNGVGEGMVEDIDGPVSVYDLHGIQRYHGERDAMPTLPRGVYIIRTANGKAEKVML